MEQRNYEIRQAKIEKQGLEDTVLMQRQILDRYRMHLTLITKPGYRGVVYEVV